MEQHKFVWIFKMNRVGKIEMKDDGITEVTLGHDTSIIHNSNFQNLIVLRCSDKRYIVSSQEEISNIIEIMKSKSNNIESLQKFATEHLEESRDF